MFPHERSLVKRMSGKPFVLLGVNGDTVDDSLKAKNEEAEITWRSFKNQASADQPQISDQWNVQGWPTLYLIDAEGIIRGKWLGSPGDAVIDEAIDKLVAEVEAK